MKFAHIADCHIGGWRDPQLKDLPLHAFKQAIDISLQKHVDFILISGDLFNTSIPALDQLKQTTEILKQIKDQNIPVYIIPGSHDFSPSGKTMLEVLESADLLTNVVKGEVVKEETVKGEPEPQKRNDSLDTSNATQTTSGKLKLNFTIDKKTNTKITGMIGKRGMLEKSYYESLVRDHLEDEPGFKIFMFHTAITELKPKNLEKMESSPISLLPKNFDYYAGGHVHIVKQSTIDGYKNVIYPGPLFPNSFSELEELKKGGFFIYEKNEQTKEETITRENIILHPVISLTIECNHKTPSQIEQIIKEKLNNQSVQDGIVLLRLKGILESGKVADINFKEIFEITKERGAFFIMKNTSMLKTKDFEEIKIDHSEAEVIEQNIITEHVGQIKVANIDPEKEKEMINQLMTICAKTKADGEKVADYQDRIKEDAASVLKLEE